MRRNRAHCRASAGGFHNQSWLSDPSAWFRFIDEVPEYIPEEKEDNSHSHFYYDTLSKHQYKMRRRKERHLQEHTRHFTGLLKHIEKMKRKPKCQNRGKTLWGMLIILFISLSQYSMQINTERSSPTHLGNCSHHSHTFHSPIHYSPIPIFSQIRFQSDKCCYNYHFYQFENSQSRGKSVNQIGKMEPQPY